MRRSEYSANRLAIIFRICEFLISSVNTSPAGTKTFAAGVGAAVV
jgi:hypothetical protein